MYNKTIQLVFLYLMSPLKDLLGLSPSLIGLASLALLAKTPLKETCLLWPNPYILFKVLKRWRSKVKWKHFVVVAAMIMYQCKQHFNGMIYLHPPHAVMSVKQSQKKPDVLNYSLMRFQFSFCSLILVLKPNLPFLFSSI